jgi:predicted house-cleaning NTP pyrophosphatase (Maf/HAM1 superfamily)
MYQANRLARSSVLRLVARSDCSNSRITGNPVLDYAGAFESEAVLRFAERICGSYHFVRALPVSTLIEFLRRHVWTSEPKS